MIDMIASKIAKVTHPILTGVLPRKRLFTLLDRMWKRSFIWVSGAPRLWQDRLGQQLPRNPGTPLPLVPDRPR